VEDRQATLEKLREIDATYYHEAGHAVIGELFGFRPLRIEGPLCVHDRRTSAFFRQDFLFRSPKTRERASQYAIGLAAGIAAESKGTGEPFNSLRETSGEGDYEKLECLLERLMLSDCRSDSPEARQNQMQLWEAKAKALLERPEVWAAVESVVSYLYDGLGELDADDIAAAIREGRNAVVYANPDVEFDSLKSGDEL
jgi:hypothetical protein